MNSYSKIIKHNIKDLVKDNITLVKKIAWHLHGRVSAIIEIEDLIQIGMCCSKLYTSKRCIIFFICQY
jgi:DNA-directed RNA polymerase specialized sigma subunit